MVSAQIDTVIVRFRDGEWRTPFSRLTAALELEYRLRLPEVGYAPDRRVAAALAVLEHWGAINVEQSEPEEEEETAQGPDARY